MSLPSVSTPARLPVPAEDLVGRIVRIPAGRCRYRDADLVLTVRAVRTDISLWYGGEWVWLHGDEIDRAGRVVGWTPVLVHVSACIPDDPTAPS